MKNKQVFFSQTRNKGFSLIELLIVLTIVGMLALLAIWTFHLQIMKGRDAKRKADLAKLQLILEDYFNDNDCYPETLTCNDSFLSYLSSIPCDPVNDGLNHVYFYSVSQQGTCKRWYKIFTTLENQKDTIIKKIGCTQANCGPFNYLVASSNTELLTQQLGEVYPPVGGTPPASPTGGGATATPTPTQGPTSTPTPTPAQGPTPTPTPTQTPCLSGWYTCVNQGGWCNISVEGAPGAVCNSTCNQCNIIYNGRQVCRPVCY